MYVDEQALAILADYLIRLMIGEVPAWVISLLEYLMAWTIEANNGPPGAPGPAFGGPRRSRSIRRDRTATAFSGCGMSLAIVANVEASEILTACKFADPPSRRRSAARPRGDALKEITVAAGISGAPAMPRGLRHSFGVNAFQSNVPPHLVQRWLGHASLADCSHLR
jgi:hypothetical protein